MSSWAIRKWIFENEMLDRLTRDQTKLSIYLYFAIARNIARPICPMLLWILPKLSIATLPLPLHLPFHVHVEAHRTPSCISNWHGTTISNFNYDRVIDSKCSCFVAMAIACDITDSAMASNLHDHNKAKVAVRLAGATGIGLLYLPHAACRVSLTTLITSR